MNVEIRMIDDVKVKESIAREVLYDLPEWFRMPESTESYIRDSKDMPHLAAYADSMLDGFIVLNATSPDTADIFVMGIKKEFHRKGIGRKLYEAYERKAKDLGFSYFQVKTVQTGLYEEYDITNNFYKAMGYVELECFPDMWDSWNPFQIYIKYLDKYE